MWTNKKPKASGFYWHRDISGDIRVVMRDSDGRFWCSKCVNQREVPLDDIDGQFWDSLIFPLL